MVRAWIRDHGLLCAPVDAVRDSSAAEGAIPSPATEIANAAHLVATESQAAVDAAQEQPDVTGVAVGDSPPEEIEHDGQRWRLASGFRRKGSRKIGDAIYEPVEAQ